MPPAAGPLRLDFGDAAAAPSGGEPSLAHLRELAAFVERGDMEEATSVPRALARAPAAGSARRHEAERGGAVNLHHGAPSLSLGPGGHATALALPREALEEQERRVRRRHRKRLARIVADQWMSLARERALLRLAARHRWRSVLRHALAGWANILDLRREQWTSAIVFSTRMIFRALGRSLAQWAAYRSARMVKTAARRWAEQWRGRRTKSRAFSALQEFAVRHQQKRRTALTAGAYRTLVLLSLALSAWRKAAVVGRERGAKVEEALHHWAECLQGRAISAWAEYLARRRVRQEIRQRAEDHRLRSVAANALVSWRAVVAGAVASLGRAADHSRARLGRRAVVGWRVESARGRELGATAAAVRAVMARGSLGAAYRTWKVALSIREASRCAQALDHWEKAHQRQAFGGWRAVRERAVWLRRCEVELSARTRTSRLARAAFAWRAGADLRRAKRAIMHAAASMHEQQLLARAVSEWRKAAALLAIESRQSEVAFLHYSAVLMGRAWAGFVDARRLGRGLRRAAKHYSHCLREKALEAWALRVEYKSLRERMRRRAVRHHYRSTLREALGAWTVLVGMHREELQRRERASVHLKRHLLRASLAAWRFQYLPAARLKRRERVGATAQWRRGVLSRAIAAWRAGVSRRVDKRAAAERAARHWRTRMFHMGMRGWGRYIDHLAKKREALAARVAELRRELGGAKRRRIWEAWGELHAEGCMKRFHLARACGHHREATERAVIGAWRARLVEVRQSRRASAAAASKRDRWLCAGAWAGWAAFRELRKHAQRLRAQALWHWCLAVERRAVRGWAAWVERRAGKRAAVAGALQLHQKRLQQLGAREWLKVGLRRQAARLEGAMEQQAHHAMLALARAEPFARRWKHCALHRRSAGITGARRGAGILTPSPERAARDDGECRGGGGVSGLASRWQAKGSPMPSPPPGVGRSPRSVLEPPHSDDGAVTGAGLLRPRGMILAAPAERPPPRRPAFLFEDFAGSAACFAGWAERPLASQVSREEKGSRGLAGFLSHASGAGTVHGRSSASPPSGSPPPVSAHQHAPPPPASCCAAGDDLDLATMERMLLDFEALTMELAECRAQLDILRKAGGGGRGGGVMPLLEARVQELAGQRWEQRAQVRAVAERLRGAL